MTATNHVLTGVLIVSVIHNPLIALPLALLSHFALDALPHYGNPLVGTGTTKFNLILGTDIYLALACFGLLILLQPAHLWLLVLGGVLAASPDLMWLPDFTAALRHAVKPVYGSIRQFHARIQWYQRPNGAYIEAAWFVAVFIACFGFTI